ncbi:transposable element Tcb1 transposase [Trichonephila clavipes]|nr:transposable element Tcb1 transposase [Trichonephila clavipes]
MTCLPWLDTLTTGLPQPSFNTGTSVTASTVVPSQINVECYRLPKVVFSDESRFVLGTDDNRVRVWRRPAYDSRSPLIVMRGTLTGQRYVDDILRPHVGPFLNGLSGAIFQQDYARPHTARVAQDFLRLFQTLP